MGLPRTACLLPLVAVASLGAQCAWVAITGPANGTTYTSAQTVTITGGVAQELAQKGISKLEFRDNGTLRCTDLTSPYQCSWSFTSANNGQHEWTARAYLSTGEKIDSYPTTLTVAIGGTALGDPELVGFLPGIGTAMDVVVDGAEAFVASAEFGMSVLDAANRALVGSAQQPFNAQHAAVVGNRAVAGGLDQGKAHFWVLDVTDATMPVVRGELATSLLQGVSTGFQDLALDTTGTRAVAAMGTAGIWVIDLTNPAAPRVLGTYDTPGTAWGVVLVGSVAYVADGTGGLRILSIANPSQPTLLGSLSLSGVMRDVAVSGSVAYLANQQGGIKVVNVADARAPVFIGAASAGSAFHISVSGTRLGVYEPNSTGGVVEIFDVSNPATPRLQATLDLFDGRGITLVGSLAYVPDGSAGVKIYSLGTGGTPVLTAAIPVVGSASGLVAEGSRVYTADSLAAISILE